MNNIIYYFSGTGNSLAVSKMLGKALNNAEIISMSRVMKDKQTISIEGQSIGLVFPVYCHTIPTQVKEFIEKAN